MFLGSRPGFNFWVGFISRFIAGTRKLDDDMVGACVLLSACTFLPVFSTRAKSGRRTHRLYVGTYTAEPENRYIVAPEDVGLLPVRDRRVAIDSLRLLPLVPLLPRQVCGGRLLAMAFESV